MPENSTADNPEKAANEVRCARFIRMAVSLAQQLRASSDDGVVKLWDLRKATSFFELDLCKTQSKLKLGAIHSISFNASGSHLAVASAQAIPVLKEVSKNHWYVVKTFSDNKAAVTGVQFAPDSSFLASTSMDRSLKIYTQAKEA
ncbi:hypothetical protein PsorP6_017367 [Peronosclerospora sorghi]|uniref:Uncharacterized protein n=1 Tax=Peronosclerospora sorghi TaxID=230839 RepID=A0ACC0WL62_9STRA|nr:hypothetical protein PsorP6_017367 [Peronosclerospora sorghi]